MIYDSRHLAPLLVRAGCCQVWYVEHFVWGICWPGLKVIPISSEPGGLSQGYFQFDLDSGSLSDWELIFSKVNKPIRDFFHEKMWCIWLPWLACSSQIRTWALFHSRLRTAVSSRCLGPRMGEALATTNGNPDREECMVLGCPKCVPVCMCTCSVCLAICVTQMFMCMFLCLQGTCVCAYVYVRVANWCKSACSNVCVHACMYMLFWTRVCIFFVVLCMHWCRFGSDQFSFSTLPNFLQPHGL